MTMMINCPLAFAGACIHAGDYSGAELACRQVLEWDPGVGEAWYILGVASQLLGKIAESVACYRNSVRLVPGNPEAWNNQALHSPRSAGPRRPRRACAGPWKLSPAMPRRITTWAMR